MNPGETIFAFARGPDGRLSRDSDGDVALFSSETYNERLGWDKNIRAICSCCGERVYTDSDFFRKGLQRPGFHHMGMSGAEVCRRLFKDSYDGIVSDLLHFLKSDARMTDQDEKSVNAFYERAKAKASKKYSIDFSDPEKLKHNGGLLPLLPFCVGEELTLERGRENSLVSMTYRPVTGKGGKSVVVWNEKGEKINAYVPNFISLFYVAEDDGDEKYRPVVKKNGTPVIFEISAFFTMSLAETASSFYWMAHRERLPGRPCDGVFNKQTELFRYIS